MRHPEIGAATTQQAGGQQLVTEGQALLDLGLRKFEAVLPEGSGALPHQTGSRLRSLGREPLPGGQGEAKGPVVAWSNLVKVGRVKGHGGSSPRCRGDVSVPCVVSGDGFTGVYIYQALPAWTQTHTVHCRSACLTQAVKKNNKRMAVTQAP